MQPKLGRAATQTQTSQDWKKFMVVATNKNLGPVILETPLYI
jgi:hypothetical protein